MFRRRICTSLKLNQEHLTKIRIKGRSHLSIEETLNDFTPPGGAKRIAKLTALSIGVALLATACGGSFHPEFDRLHHPGSIRHCLPGTQRHGRWQPAPLTAGAGGPVPAATTTTPTPLKIGSLLPTTGSLAFLGPPEIAGVNLGIKEVNDAGGVLGKPVSK
jgi:branched-chain amino acid transport system substrate-binding protein